MGQVMKILPAVPSPVAGDPFMGSAELNTPPGLDVTTKITTVDLMLTGMGQGQDTFPSFETADEEAMRRVTQEILNIPSPLLAGLPSRAGETSHLDPAQRQGPAAVAVGSPAITVPTAMDVEDSADQSQHSGTGGKFAPGPSTKPLSTPGTSPRGPPSA